MDLGFEGSLKMAGLSLKAYAKEGGGCCMFISRKGNVALSILRKRHVAMSILRKCHVACH